MRLEALAATLGVQALQRARESIQRRDLGGNRPLGFKTGLWESTAGDRTMWAPAAPGLWPRFSPAFEPLRALAGARPGALGRKAA